MAEAYTFHEMMTIIELLAIPQILEHDVFTAESFLEHLAESVPEYEDIDHRAALAAASALEKFRREPREQIGAWLARRLEFARTDDPEELYSLMACVPGKPSLLNKKTPGRW
jgi:hypothetical protein